LHLNQYWCNSPWRKIIYVQSIQCVSSFLIKVHTLQSSCRRRWIVEKGENGRQQCQRSQRLGSRQSRMHHYTDTHIADSEGSNSPPRTRGSACAETNTHEEMMANVLKLALRCQRNIEEKEIIHHAMMAEIAEETAQEAARINKQLVKMEETLRRGWVTETDRNFMLAKVEKMHECY
jgi:hypothetical protein